MLPNVYKIISIDSFLVTVGLKKINNYEISIFSYGDTLGEKNLLSYLAEYVINENKIIKSDETISYGLWLLKLTLENNVLNVYELTPDFTTWIKGAENAIYYYEQQKELCKGESTSISIPQFTQNIVVSKGVFEGLNVQGVRYLEPSHMSGWYLTTSEYDKNITSLSVVPIQELVVKRKDLIQFLALPVGYIFETLSDYKCRIWQLSELGDNISGN